MLHDLRSGSINLYPLHQGNLHPSPPSDACLDQQWENVSGSDEQTILPRRTSAPCPLSFAQQKFWFLLQLEPQSTLHTVAKSQRLPGILNAEALQQTLETIVARHQVLRTTFALGDGGLEVVADNRMRFRFIQSPLLQPDTATIARRIIQGNDTERLSRGVSQRT
jgi:hypothetical protein